MSAVIYIWHKQCAVYLITLWQWRGRCKLLSSCHQNVISSDWRALTLPAQVNVHVKHVTLQYHREPSVNSVSVNIFCADVSVSTCSAFAELWCWGSDEWQERKRYHVKLKKLKSTWIFFARMKIVTDDLRAGSLYWGFVSETKQWWFFYYFIFFTLIIDVQFPFKWVG